MIIVDVPQNSEEWQAVRAHALTASRVNMLLTSTLKPSAQRDKLKYHLLAQWAVGVQEPSGYSTWHMDRGMAFEQESRDLFEYSQDLIVRPTGFIFKDESKHVGVSPDWLCYQGDSLCAGCESKTPSAAKHLEYLGKNEVPAEYKHQVQFSLWVTGLPAWFFVSYYPELPHLVLRETPEPEFQEAYETTVPQFLEELEEAKQNLMKRGVEPYESRNSISEQSVLF